MRMCARSKPGAVSEAARIIDDIRRIFKDVDITSANFSCLKGRRPTFIREGITYTMFFAFLEDDGSITISAIATNPWSGSVKDFVLDESWRKSSLEKVKRNVDRYFNVCWDC